MPRIIIDNINIIFREIFLSFFMKYFLAILIILSIKTLGQNKDSIISVEVISYIIFKGAKVRKKRENNDEEKGLTAILDGRMALCSPS